MTTDTGSADDDYLSELATADAELDGAGRLPTSSGTFSIRRTHYLTETLAETGRLLISAEQQHALDTLLPERDPEKKQKAILQNLSLVVKIAGRYSDRGIGPFELIREGNRGLIQALERFEPGKGYRFSAFASMCISQYIEIAILKRNAHAELSRDEMSHAVSSERPHGHSGRRY